MVRDQVPAGGAGIAVAVVMKPFHTGPGPIFAKQRTVKRLLLSFI